MRKTPLLLAALLLLVIPLATASHCDYDDCPLWAQQGHYATPTSTHTSSYWHDDTRSPNNRYYGADNHRYDNHRDYDRRYDDRYDRRPRTTHYTYEDIYHPPRILYVRYNDNYYTHQTTTRTRRNTYSSYRRSSPSVYRGSHFNRYY